MNWILLLVWWAMFVAAGDWMYALHAKWFKIPRPTLDGIQYGAMAFYKIVIFVFNLIPYLVLRLFF